MASPSSLSSLSVLRAPAGALGVQEGWMRSTKNGLALQTELEAEYWRVL